MPLDTAVDGRFQEQLEQAVRDVIAGVSQTDLDVCRELPPPRQPDASLDLDCAPELDALTVESLPDEQVLGVTLYFDDKPDGAVPVVPDELDDPGYAFPGRTPDARPTALAELGGGYAALSTAVVETLTAYCDAPEHCPEQVFVGEEADLVCTSCYSGLLTFVGYLWYPGYIEDVYSEGHQDLAHRLGLPF